jgi:hypothetical protein
METGIERAEDNLPWDAQALFEKVYNKDPQSAEELSYGFGHHKPRVPFLFQSLPPKYTSMDLIFPMCCK